MTDVQSHSRPGPEAGPATPAPRAPRWMRIALIASLTVNLLILGIFGGAALGRWRHVPRPPISDVGFGPYTDALDPDDRRSLREAYLAEMPNLRNLRREAREDVLRLAAVLRAEPWDPVAAQEVMSQRTDRTIERVMVGQSLFLQRLDAMAPAERHAMADRLEALLTRPHGTDEHGGGDHD